MNQIWLEATLTASWSPQEIETSIVLLKFVVDF